MKPWWDETLPIIKNVYDKSKDPKIPKDQSWTNYNKAQVLKEVWK